MEKLVPAILRNGKEILVLPQEIEILRSAGVLAKDFKPAPDVITKDAAAELNEGGVKVNPTISKVPVNISSKNIKGGRPKKA